MRLEKGRERLLHLDDTNLHAATHSHQHHLLGFVMVLYDTKGGIGEGSQDLCTIFPISHKSSILKAKEDKLWKE